MGLFLTLSNARRTLNGPGVPGRCRQIGQQDIHGHEAIITYHSSDI